FHQDKYWLGFERVEVVWYNKSYIDYLKVHNFKFNRTQAACNMTVHHLVDIDEKFAVEVQAYKFLSNEYREFPIRLNVDFCGTLAVNDFGMHGVLECGNFTACPMRKGWYHVCNFKPDAKRFPPLIPEGSYMVEMKIFRGDIQFIIYQAYATVKYPFLFN
ncbi:hypothetical protein ILUMI_02502, partial [Ignelater luminosus]